MKEGPSESAYRSGLQTAFRRLWTKAMVVSAKGKGPARTGSGVRQEEDRKETTIEVSKATSDDAKTAAWLLLRDRALTVPVYGQGGIRHERWPELAMRRISGTWEPAIAMLTEKSQVETPRGREYGCARAGTGQRVLAMKSPTKGWSQGAVSRSLISTSQPAMGGAR